MKAKTFTEHLKNGLSTVSKVVSARNQLPILGNVLIIFSENEGIILLTTNLEISIKTTVKASIEKEGTTTTPLKIFNELISLAKEEKLEIETKGNSLVITSKNNNYTLATANPEDFPQVTKKNKEELLNLDPKILSQILNLVSIATTQDETRPLLGGVLVQKNEKGLDFVATDGYRLSVKTTKLKDISLNQGLILPIRTLLEVDRIAKEKKAEKIVVNLYQENKMIEFIIDNTEIISRLIEGEFPKFQKIIPPSFTTRIIMERDELLNSVKSASVFARESANIIKMSLKNNTVSLSAKAAQVGETNLNLNGEKTGEDLEIAFNYRFLLELLNALSSERVVFESNGSLSPGIFKAEKDDSFLHVIMPVRIQE